MWIGGSSDAAIRRTALLGTGWQAGGETPAEAAPVIDAIRRASAKAGRPLDEDHYGAAFSFRFGSPDDPALRPAMDSYHKRTGRDPLGYFAVGGRRDDPRTHRRLRGGGRFQSSSCARPPPATRT